MMDNQGKKKAAHLFASVFAQSLGASIAEAVKGPWPLEVVDSLNPPTSKDKPLHFRLTVDGALSGECFIEFYEEQVSELVAKIRMQPVEPITDQHTELMSQLIIAATRTFAVALADDYGKVAFKVDRVAGLAFGGMFVVPLISASDTTGAPILLYLDGTLLDALSSVSDGADKDDAESRGIHPHNLKMVMDVELNVSLRFGKRQLPLREVLELGSGSVIELDRLVDEPVDLFLDGKLIARGEAVIVDGNYGLRVTEIPQPLASHLFG